MFAFADSVRSVLSALVKVGGRSSGLRLGFSPVGVGVCQNQNLLDEQKDLVVFGALDR